jgi:hypothetical protein
LQIVFTALGELTEGWVHVTAEATKDAAKDKATLINSKVEGYDFRLPSDEADRLGWTMTDLSVEQKSRDKIKITRKKKSLRPPNGNARTWRGRAAMDPRAGPA